MKGDSALQGVFGNTKGYLCSSHLVASPTLHGTASWQRTTQGLRPQPRLKSRVLGNPNVFESQRGGPLPVSAAVEFQRASANGVTLGCHGRPRSPNLHCSLVGAYVGPRNGQVSSLSPPALLTTAPWAILHHLGGTGMFGPVN